MFGSETSARKKVIAVAGALTALFGVYTAGGVYTVPEGTATIETTGGKITDTAQPGFHHRWLGIQGTHNYNTTKVFEVELKDQNIYYSPDELLHGDTKTGEQKSPLTAEELANQNAQQYTTHQAKIRVSIDPQAVQTLHRKYQSMEAIKRLVEDRGTEAYKAVVRKIDPLKINTQREIIGPNVKDLLQTTIDREVGQGGVIQIESVVFLDFHFEKGVESAFEKANEERAKVQAEQFKLQQENIKVDTQRKQGEAAAARQVAEAEGRAKAIEKEGEALRKNPEIIQLRAIEAWEKGGAQVPDTLVIPDGNNAANYLLPLGSQNAPTPKAP